MEFLSLDLPPLLAAIFAAVACALLGNYLVLRKLSLMGDAISHSVLPGIVIAFLLFSTRTGIWIFVGAALAGVLSATLIEAVRKFGRVETGASMGVVFSIFFALGILLIEQAAARSVELDVDCLLHGQLETIFWYPPNDLYAALWLFPSEVYVSLFTLVLVVVFVLVFYKELKLASFDPSLSDSLGFSTNLLQQLLMIVLACAVVASFKVVGSILVIAMLICPAASARLWTDRLKIQLLLSALFAVMACLLGYVLGAFVPLWLGFQNSVSIAGMITVVAGLLLTGSIFFAPYYGLFARGLRRLRLALRVRKEDILALLYRVSESKEHRRVERVLSVFGISSLSGLALFLLKREGLVANSGSSLVLTPSGISFAKGIVRSHRLWESYLVKELKLAPDHVHETAEKLEHVTTPSMQERMGPNEVDPHGKLIP